MNKDDCKVGDYVAHSSLANAPVYKILDILEKGEFVLLRHYGNEINTPYHASINLYRKATSEQCRNAWLVT
jgi:hypothetical protein